MSIQSDVEMLSIQAMEYYANTHKLSEKEASDIFYRHQVFEKIVLQHEYLHQLDFSETISYVEEIIDEKVADLLIYHGSNVAFNEIDLSKSHNRRFWTWFLLYCIEKSGKRVGTPLVYTKVFWWRIYLSVCIPPNR